MSDMPRTLFILNGPNLNLLGRREPEIYGREPLPAIDARLRALADELGVSLDIHQSNLEGELVTRVQRALGVADVMATKVGSEGKRAS